MSDNAVPLNDLFSKGEVISKDLPDIIELICSIDKKSWDMDRKFYSREYISEKEKEDYLDEQENLLHQIEELLELDTDYRDDEVGQPEYKVQDSRVLEGMRKYLPFFNGIYTDFFILPNGTVMRFGSGGYPRLSFYENLEEASCSILDEVKTAENLENYWDDWRSAQ